MNDDEPFQMDRNKNNQSSIFSNTMCASYFYLVVGKRKFSIKGLTFNIHFIPIPILTIHQVLKKVTYVS
jgi:hypothetical protein